MTNVLNTLFITTEGASLHAEGPSLRVVVAKETRAQVPLHHLASVVCFARVYVTPDAMAACTEAGTSVVFLGWSGRYLARVEGPSGRTATLRREQYRAADDPARSLSLARGFVAGKVANGRTVLRRAARTRERSDSIDVAADRLAHVAERVLDAPDLDVLRGHEGEAASRYFEVLDAMIARDDLHFESRARRPPTDPINAMLSFAYSLLASDCQSAVQAAGLDPAVGYLHVERPGRPALALDLMEELRPVIADRLVVATLRLGQFGPDDFERMPTGECRFKENARNRFLVVYQGRKRDEIAHPLAAEPIPWAMVPLVQARLLARAIRNETEYVPFLVK